MATKKKMTEQDEQAFWFGVNAVGQNASPMSKILGGYLGVGFVRYCKNAESNDSDEAPKTDRSKANEPHR